MIRSPEALDRSLPARAPVDERDREPGLHPTLLRFSEDTGTALVRLMLPVRGRPRRPAAQQPLVLDAVQSVAGDQLDLGEAHRLITGVDEQLQLITCGRDLCAHNG